MAIHFLQSLPDANVHSVSLSLSFKDFRVLKILPSNLDVVEDIKQIGNEYYFKKDVEVVVDDSENEIVDSEGGRRKAEPNQPTVNSAATATTELTETLDIVVLPAPTKDIEIYENELLEPGNEGLPSARPEDDISVIGLITPTRPAVTTSSIANGAANDAPGPGSAEPSSERNEGGEDLRDDDESLAVLSEGRAGSPYRRLVRAGAAAGEPRAEALQAATIHSFHNLKILKPVDDEEAEEDQQGGLYEQRQQQHQKHQDQQQQQQQQHRYNDTEMDRNQQETDGATATRNRNRQRQKVFSQVRLPSPLPFDHAT